MADTSRIINAQSLLPARRLSLCPSYANSHRLHRMRVVAPVGNVDFHSKQFIDENPEAKRERIEKVQEQLEMQHHQREQQLKNESAKMLLQSELKFAQMLMKQGKYEAAMPHLEKISKGMGEQTWLHGEATLQLAVCLEKLGRESEALPYYQSLVHFRAPFPSIRRQAAAALNRTSKGGDGSMPSSSPSSLWDDYLYRIYSGGWNTYAPWRQQAHEDTEEEKMVMRLIPWSLMLMGPFLLMWLMLLHHEAQ
eukprot:TRINITY_DN632_c0_g1_i11.p1 TRINITY_DN632_c0_g1~~TRINITY_DN632_c0_g1_i11.p1  ORF type:complete len:251 (+),score=53.72 TRINITY_DN632_c0_g1_i11:149-901(+)